MKKIMARRLSIFTGIFFMLCAAKSSCASNKHFAVIIPSWNNSEWCERNISMLVNQDYDNWHAIYINDASTDDTGQKVAGLIKHYHAESKIILINNERRQGALANIYKAVHMCDDGDVVITYDGDDWFNGRDVFKTLNEAYADENVWMTYGSYQDYPGGARGECSSCTPKEVIVSNGYRKDEWRASHLRSFYAWLFKSIKIEDLKVDGVFIPATYDQAIMFPMLEMAGGRFKYILDVLYNYNMATPNNDHKVHQELQKNMENIIRSRLPYAPLKEIHVSELLESWKSSNIAKSVENWESMQHLYKELYNTLSSDQYQQQKSSLRHPHWETAEKNIQKLVLGSCNPNFLHNHDIEKNMLRSGMSVTQAYELCFLQECISKKTKKALAQFEDTSFGSLTRACSEFNCSTSTLGHLFYAARTMDLMHDDPKTIVEFGGGYGNLARVYQHFLPHSTYIMIDLPEVIALQYFFLKETVSNKKIIMHTQAPAHYEEDAIHLIPVEFTESMNVKADLFVSTFALSEASATAQNIVEAKKFFNAANVYIVGQLNGWDSSLNFVHHSNIHNGLRAHYKDVDCHPYHLTFTNSKSYEIIAKAPVSRGPEKEISSDVNTRFAVIIPSRNNSQWCERNISMLVNQDYNNWHAIYINDASTDDTGQKIAELIKHYHVEDKITLINNETRQGAMANIYNAIYMCDDHDVIVNYDGDDWFHGIDVLKKLNDVYADKNVWLTYGSYLLHPSGERSSWIDAISDETIRSNNYRESHERCTGHLRTFYAWLFKRIKIDDLKVDGLFFPMTYDLAMMFPMFEMAGGRFKYINDILYVYNIENPFNDYKVDQSLQIKLDGYIRALPPYPPLTSIYVIRDQASS